MFRVKKKQFEAFEAMSRQRFEAELEEHLRAELPDEHAALGEDSVRQIVSWSIDRGQKYGFITEEQVCLFATAALFLGPDFETAPEHRWARHILDDPDYL